MYPVFHEVDFKEFFSISQLINIILVLEEGCFLIMFLQMILLGTPQSLTVV